MSDLFFAIYQGNSQELSDLLADDANIEYRNCYGETPLVFAAMYGKCDCIRVLLNAGADVHAIDHLGRSSLYYASIYNGGPVVSMLIEAGAQIDLADSGGKTPLMNASCNDAPVSVKTLLDAGADKDLMDNDLWTALGIATRRKHRGVIRVFRKRAKKERYLLPRVIAQFFDCGLPRELADICGDYVVLTTARRLVSK